MSASWATVDQNTRWSAGSQSPYVLHREPVRVRRFPGAVCEVRAVAGALAPGRDDILMELDHPGMATQPLNMTLLSEVSKKVNAYPHWTSTELILAMIRVVVFEEDPGVAAQARPPHTRLPGALPGVPLVSFLCLTQGFALSESRKFASAGPHTGRYLPLRLAMGIASGRWSLSDIPASILRINPLPILRDQKGREPKVDDVLLATSFGIPPGLSRQQRNAVFA